MPLDHYVSQVHLKNFYSPSLGERMHAIRKVDIRAFTARSQDVCRTEDGSTNDYLCEPRAIEEFLKKVEPNYNASVQKLRMGAVDKQDVYVIGSHGGTAFGPTALLERRARPLPARLA